MAWVHSCLAIDSTLNHLTWVVNGKKLEDKAFPIPAGEQPLSNLTGKLLIYKVFVGFWYQSNNKISNLNIFSKQLTLAEMVSRTAGDDCKKSDGDYLDWESSEWVLKGRTSLGEVTVEDLCRRESRIQIFTYLTGALSQCMDLCAKIQKGTMATMRNPNETQAFVARLNQVLVFPNGEPKEASSISLSAWVAARRADDGSWLDVYNQAPVEKTMATWAKGNPGLQRCANYVLPWKGVATFDCVVDTELSPFYCPCHFNVSPNLILKGLCPGSNIDQAYLARNDPATGYLYFYGSHKTIATFDGKKWEMLTAFFNTSASTPDKFILGKHSWSINGDSEKCHLGKPYTTKLKLTGCNQFGEFTCDDGQCVKMVERCNQVPDCRDESDENGCQLIVFKDNYNKNIPPIGQTAKGVAIPANVSISITLMKVVEIEEIDHSIHLQFEITMRWRENRVKYQNLKEKTSLNALTDADIGQIWLPLIIFDNTDQKESTRLGEKWEWVTGVSIIKEGQFTRSGVEEVDEAEIFLGNENTLMMTQTYTHEFQCTYKLQQYPFDTQVREAILFQ